MSVELKHGLADGTAEEFILAAMHLSKMCSELKYIAPTMVCFAFAIELHFKAILAELNIDPGKEHSLCRLYQKLPEAKKLSVTKMYCDVAGNISSDDFESEVRRWSSAFVEIRYSHDRTDKGAAYFDFSNFIPNLAIAINNGYPHTQKYEKFCFPQL